MCPIVRIRCFLWGRFANRPYGHVVTNVAQRGLEPQPNMSCRGWACPSPSKLAGNRCSPCGSAAPLCGKAPPFRPDLPIFSPSSPPGRLSLPCGEEGLVAVLPPRKGGAFPHSGAAEPQVIGQWPRCNLGRLGACPALCWAATDYEGRASRPPTSHVKCFQKYLKIEFLFEQASVPF